MNLVTHFLGQCPENRFRVGKFLIEFMKYISRIFVTLLVVTSCASLSDPAPKPKSYHYSPSENQLSFDQIERITNEQLKGYIMRFFLSNTKYGAFQDKCGKIQGLSIHGKGNSLNIEYINGRKFCQGLRAGATDYFSTSFQVDFGIQETKSGFSVYLKSNDSVKVQSNDKVIWNNYRPLASYKSITNDFKNLIETFSFTLTMKSSRKGEFNVKYKDDEVYGNFDRHLERARGSQGSKDEVRKVVKYRVKGERDTDNLVNISIYPYRGGSKIVYEIFVNHTVYPNKKVQATDKILDDIAVQIEKIANM